ncbi:MAG: hypothetical protein JF595_16500 [Sphingomonadales bacterium]|nr:hypothetical protein [Sphingomonadales bacterium]
MAEIYAASPNLAVIERLHQRERELRREDMERTDRFSERFFRSLSPEDRLKYMKMTYPPPVRIHIPDQQRTGGK